MKQTAFWIEKDEARFRSHDVPYHEARLRSHDVPYHEAWLRSHDVPYHEARLRSRRHCSLRKDSCVYT